MCVVYRSVLPDQRVFGFCVFLVLCRYCLENRVIRNNGVLVLHVFFCSGSLGNVLFFYGDHVLPFASDTWDVRSVFYCATCSVLMGVRISIFFLVDLHLLC
jgi:predicted permease